MNKNVYKKRNISLSAFSSLHHILNQCIDISIIGPDSTSGLHGVDIISPPLEKSKVSIVLSPNDQLDPRLRMEGKEGKQELRKIRTRTYWSTTPPHRAHPNISIGLQVIKQSHHSLHTLCILAPRKLPNYTFLVVILQPLSRCSNSLHSNGRRDAIS